MQAASQGSLGIYCWNVDLNCDVSYSDTVVMMKIKFSWGGGYKGGGLVQNKDYHGNIYYASTALAPLW